MVLEGRLVKFTRDVPFRGSVSGNLGPGIEREEISRDDPLRPKTGPGQHIPSRSRALHEDDRVAHVETGECPPSPRFDRKPALAKDRHGSARADDRVRKPAPRLEAQQWPERRVCDLFDEAAAMALELFEPVVDTIGSGYRVVAARGLDIGEFVRSRSAGPVIVGRGEVEGHERFASTRRTT